MTSPIVSVPYTPYSLNAYLIRDNESDTSDWEDIAPPESASDASSLEWEDIEIPEETE